MLQCAEEVARERQHHGDRPGTARDGVAQSLAVDPVPHPVGEVPDHARVVDVPDGGVVELPERLGLPHEPRADRLVVIEVDPKADPALEQLVLGLEQHPLRRRRRRSAPGGIGRPSPSACAREQGLGSGARAGRVRSAYQAPAAPTRSAGAARGGAAPPAAPGRRGVEEEQGAVLAGAAADTTDRVRQGRGGGARDRLQGRSGRAGCEMQAPLSGDPHQAVAAGHRAAR